MDLEEPGRRRRGEELERAILAAAWDRLLESGYHNFTIDAVAERAGTSRSVLYRRWPDRDALIGATLAYGFETSRVAAPDTGTLREDVLALLRIANTERARILPLMSVLMGSYFSPAGATFASVRREILGERAGGAMDVILERAVARGEIDAARLTPRVLTVAFDLFRHDLLMTLQPLSEDDIVAIVDEVFLPLVQPGGSSAA
jgi:AcrR family transcriptional regulator